MSHPSRTLPCRVAFGSGTLSTGKAKGERLGGRRARVLTVPQQMTPVLLSATQRNPRSNRACLGGRIACQS